MKKSKFITYVGVSKQNEGKKIRRSSDPATKQELHKSGWIPEEEMNILQNETDEEIELKVRELQANLSNRINTNIVGVKKAVGVKKTEKTKSTAYKKNEADKLKVVKQEEETKQETNNDDSDGDDLGFKKD